MSRLFRTVVFTAFCLMPGVLFGADNDPPTQAQEPAHAAAVGAAPPAETAADAPVPAGDGAARQPAEPTGKKKQAPLPPDPNRRWIMKQPPYSNQKTILAPDQPVEWQSAEQKARCLAYADALDAQYKNARYYSIQGDRCKTARYSGEFLETIQKCQTGCPDAMLKNAGYDQLFIRNMRVLKSLGEESCFGDKIPGTVQSEPTTSTQP